MKLHELESRISELMTEFEDESGLSICECEFKPKTVLVNESYPGHGVIIKSRGKVEPPMVRLRLDSGGA